MLLNDDLQILSHFPAQSHASCWQRMETLQSSLQALCARRTPPLKPTLDLDERLRPHGQFEAGQQIHLLSERSVHAYTIHSGILADVMHDDTANATPYGAENEGAWVSDARHPYADDMVLLPSTLFTAFDQRAAGREPAPMRAMRDEQQKEHAMVNILMALYAAAGVARFRVSLSERFSAKGYSGKLFKLQWTRQGEGSYLCVRLGAVSGALATVNPMLRPTGNSHSVALQSEAHYHRYPLNWPTQDSDDCAPTTAHGRFVRERSVSISP